MGQSSTIDRLPDDILEKLQELLRDPRVTQLEATRRINNVLEDEGLDPVSKSSVNRYKVKMDKAGARLRQSREVAKMWIGKLGATPQGEVGNLVNELLRTLAFDMTLSLQEYGEIDPDRAPETVEMLKDLALTMQRLEKAASDNVKREKEIRKQALEEAANRIGEASEERGMTVDEADYWRKKVLGIE